jgi:F0F1-type ATP synthase assembly protein I
VTKTEPPDRGRDPRRLKRIAGNQPGIGLAFDLGLRLVISIMIGLGAGLLLDGWLKTTPVFVLAGMLVGIGAAMYTIWDVARRSSGR